MGWTRSIGPATQSGRFSLLLISGGTCGANPHAKFMGSASVTGRSTQYAPQDLWYQGISKYTSHFNGSLMCRQR